MTLSTTKPFLFIAIAFAVMLSGCAGFNARDVGPTPIRHAQQEIPESRLLDVGISVFTSRQLTKEEAKKAGTLPGIQKAENHFIPYHLKNTLQQSSYWGMVRVVPEIRDFADVTVQGHILESNGERLIVEVDVRDASGKRWFKRKYKADLTDASYEDNQPGQKDPYQDLYNTIANDMARYRADLTPDRINTVRNISQLKFAQDMAPDAFGSYLKKKDHGRLEINRLPAADDPMMDRLLRVRERDYMFVDTLNEYYENYYNDMWSPYENWRELNRTERIAQAKIRRDAMIRQAAGALMVATAILLDAKDVDHTGLLKGLLVVGGGKIFIDGINISQQRKIHGAAIEELGESFDDEMKPLVLQFEGKQYELTGSAEEQYAKWRELLKKIYYEETGFGVPDVSENPNHKYQIPNK
jgi:hypothetical protein